MLIREAELSQIYPLASLGSRPGAQNVALGGGPFQLCGLPEVLAPPVFLALEGGASLRSGLRVPRQAGGAPLRPTRGPLWSHRWPGTQAGEPPSEAPRAAGGQALSPPSPLLQACGPALPKEGAAREGRGGAGQSGIRGAEPGLAWGPRGPPPGSHFWVWLRAYVAAAVPTATAPHCHLEEARPLLWPFLPAKDFEGFLRKSN